MTGLNWFGEVHSLRTWEVITLASLTWQFFLFPNINIIQTSYQVSLIKRMLLALLEWLQITFLLACFHCFRSMMLSHWGVFCVYVLRLQHSSCHLLRARHRINAPSTFTFPAMSALSALVDGLLLFLVVSFYLYVERMHLIEMIQVVKSFEQMLLLLKGWVELYQYQYHLQL